MCELKSRNDNGERNGEWVKHVVGDLENKYITLRIDKIEDVGKVSLFGG